MRDGDPAAQSRVDQRLAMIGLDGLAVDDEIVELMMTLLPVTMTRSDLR